ncbi:MAG: hypothetical protein ABR562_01270 [Thermoplasmatota archaeon]
MPREPPGWKELADAVGLDIGEEELDVEEMADRDRQERILQWVSEQLMVHDEVPFRRVLEHFKDEDVGLARLDAIMAHGVSLRLFAIDPFGTLAVRLP